MDWIASMAVVPYMIFFIFFFFLFFFYLVPSAALWNASRIGIDRQMLATYNRCIAVAYLGINCDYYLWISN